MQCVYAWSIEKNRRQKKSKLIAESDLNFLKQLFYTIFALNIQ